MVPPRARIRLTAILMWFLAATPSNAQSLAPFYLIEPYLDSGVLLHFDTLPFKKYELQASTNFAIASPGSIQWSTLYTVPAVPFGNHYIILDPRTNAPTKCYRIVVSP